jgi:cytochrome oxidase Cu insertion factor (SCO1/SenC/PrrC family)
MRRLLPLVALFAAGCNTGNGTPAASGRPDLDWPVGTFALTERSGKTVTDQDLRGKVWVASFVFTRCTGPCPQVTATVARLQSELSDVPDVRFVTFTVDPERDDPDELKKYAAHFKADPQKWLFLTGPEKVIHKLSVEQFKQAVEKKGPDAKPGDEFAHSTRLLVVDKGGVIRGFFEGVRSETREDAAERYEAELKALKDRVRELAR